MSLASRWSRMPGWRYAVALAVAAVVALLQSGVQRLLDIDIPFMLYLPTAALVAAELGTGPGALVLLVGLARSIAWAPALAPGTEASPAHLALYVVLGSVLVAMGNSLRSNRTRAAITEDRLKMALEGTGIGVFDIDLVGRTAYASPALTDLIGVPASSDPLPLGQWRARLPEALVLDNIEYLQLQLLHGQTSYEHEISMTTPQGERIGLLLRVQIVRQGSQPVRLRGACVDVTERRKVHAQLMTARTQLSQQVDDLNQLHELSTQLLQADTLAQQLGMVLGALTHFHGARYGMVSLHDPASQRVLMENSIGFEDEDLRDPALRHGGACSHACQQRARLIETDLASAEISTAWRRFLLARGIQAIHSTPLIGPQGGVLGALTVFLEEARRPSERELRLADMCAQKAAVFIERTRTRDELQASQGRFEAVLEASGAPFVVLKPVREGQRIVDFQWAYVNRAAVQTLCRPQQELLGQRVLASMPGRWENSPEFAYCVQALEAAQTCEFDTVDGKGEQARWFHCIASPIRDDVIAIWFTDISERIRNEQLLRDSDRRKDEFLATLAHELRNPLAPIRQATVLSMSPHATEQQKRWSNEVIDRQVSHMALLLDDLLDVSRITRGALTLRKALTELPCVLTSAVETARPLIEAKEHRLLVEPCDPPILLEVDQLRLAQVIANLLTNAAKYTDPGGEIRLHAYRQGSDVVIDVHDNGIGIAPDAIPEAFRMFAQLRHAGHRTDGGLGIGLALSKGLVELHGGTLTARSRGPGHGSVFTVRLPAGHAELPPSAPAEATSHSAGRHFRVLIADDNRDASDTLAALLEVEGHELTLAYDGDEALAMWHQHRPDICLLDIGMPGRTGYQVAREIRRNEGGHRTVLVAVTGWSQLHDRELALAAGFDLHLTKPVSPSHLCRLLNGLVSAQSGQGATTASSET